VISEDAKKAGKPKPNIGARLPHDVYAELLRVKEQSGKSESQLINEAIALYLGVASEATVPDRVSQVESAIAELQQQVGSILGKFQRLAIR
jgi:predicted CopG family antitoxin